MTAFLRFLHSECSAIHSFVEEASDLEISIEATELNEKLTSFSSNFGGQTQSQLEEYFTPENRAAGDIIEDVSNIVPWSTSLRLAIAEYIVGFDIDLSLLINIVETHEFVLELIELIEMVRAFDILGAQKRFLEYELLLYSKMKENPEEQKEPNHWETHYGHRLPISFFNHIKTFTNFDWHVGIVGSKRLIEYFLDLKIIKPTNQLFTALCSYGHLEVAQWLHTLTSIDILAYSGQALRGACSGGHLLVAQWLYSLNGYGFHQYIRDIFNSACQDGHLHVVQWLYSLNNNTTFSFNVNANNDAAFRVACHHGHLEIAQWLYSLGEVKIHTYNDDAFRAACRQGHFLVAEWLYSLGGVDIHIYNHGAFRGACAGGHLEVAQWLYNLDSNSGGSIKEDTIRSIRSTNSEVMTWLKSLLTF
jgi:hypothetical protein